MSYQVCANFINSPFNNIPLNKRAGILIWAFFGYLMKRYNGLQMRLISTTQTTSSMELWEILANGMQSENLPRNDKSLPRHSFTTVLERFQWWRWILPHKNILMKHLKCWNMLDTLFLKIAVTVDMWSKCHLYFSISIIKFFIWLQTF